MKYLKLIERLFSVLFWTLLIFGFDSIPMAVLTIICALIHEGGHLIMLWLVSGKSVLPYGSVLGFRIKPVGTLTYKAELLVLIGGPLINLIIGLPLAFINGGGFFGYLSEFGVINIVTALSNLLPVRTYDGYNILTSIINIFSLPDCFRNLLSSISLIISSALTLFSLLLILLIGEGYWIFAIFFVMTLREIASRQKDTIFENS